MLFSIASTIVFIQMGFTCISLPSRAVQCVLTYRLSLVVRFQRLTVSAKYYSCECLRTQMTKPMAIAINTNTTIASELIETPLRGRLPRNNGSPQAADSLPTALAATMREMTRLARRRFGGARDHVAADELSEPCAGPQLAIFRCRHQADPAC